MKNILITLFFTLILVGACKKAEITSGSILSAKVPKLIRRDVKRLLLGEKYALIENHVITAFC